jgi:hypothetical protein
MAKDPVLEIARTLAGSISPLMTNALLSLGVSLKKNPKEYYSTSRALLRAMVAASAQQMMEDGANRDLVAQTIYEHSNNIANSAWRLFLETHPEVAKQVAAEAAKKDAVLVAQAKNFKKANPLKVVQGGLGAVPPPESPEEEDPGCQGEACSGCVECEPSEEAPS